MILNLIFLNNKMQKAIGKIRFLMINAGKQAGLI